MLVTSIFSFFQNVFNPSQHKFQFFSSICHLQTLSIWTRLKLCEPSIFFLYGQSILFSPCAQLQTTPPLNIVDGPQKEISISFLINGYPNLNLILILTYLDLLLYSDSTFTHVYCTSVRLHGIFIERFESTSSA